MSTPSSRCDAAQRRGAIGSECLRWDGDGLGGDDAVCQRVVGGLALVGQELHRLEAMAEPHVVVGEERLVEWSEEGQAGDEGPVTVDVTGRLTNDGMHLGLGERRVEQDVGAPSFDASGVKPPR